MQIWFELYRIPGKDDKDLLETVLESWFVIGRLGGFNGMNMQVNPMIFCHLEILRRDSVVNFPLL